MAEGEARQPLEPSRLEGLVFSRCHKADSNKMEGWMDDSIVTNITFLNSTVTSQSPLGLIETPRITLIHFQFLHINHPRSKLLNTLI